MSFRRCYSLLSTARQAGKINTDLIARYISRSNGLRRCLSKEKDGPDDSPDDFKIPDLGIPLKCMGIGGETESYAPTAIGGEIESYAPTAIGDSDSNISETLSPRILQQIVTVPSCDSFLDDSDVTLPGPLDKCTEDLSDVGPYLTPTFTFAKYANKSRTIQELVKLGVSLYRFEARTEMVQYILGLDFEHNIKPYIRFLNDCGVPADYLGRFITKNPDIFKEDMDDLYTRIRYLRAHNFDVDMISTIICKNPKWLLYSTKDIDGRLGYFQSNFRLNGGQVRFLVLKGPNVVTYKMLHLIANTFSIKEEMGFDKKQARELLLKLPRVWTKNRERLMNVFNYAHNEMQLSRDIIVQMPHILLCRKTRLQQRHSFLVELKRTQYDPSKPMYVSPIALISGTDVDFCRDIAKTSVEVYNAFLKTF